MRLIIADIETTGLDPAEGAEIIELGLVILNDGEPDAMTRAARPFALEAEHSVLVRPTRPIPAEMSAVHHIIDEDVRDGVAAAGALGLLELYDGYLVAHNAAFEQRFLDPSAARQWLCTFKAAKRLWEGLPKYSNQALRYSLGLVRLPQFGWDRDQLNNAHRALPDARVTAGIVECVLHQTDVATAVRWCTEPEWMPRIGFGAHRGRLWADLPLDYLQWIDGQQNFNNVDAQYWARQELDRRSAVVQ